jgi:hypothetical protein
MTLIRDAVSLLLTFKTYTFKDSSTAFIFDQLKQRLQYTLELNHS